MKIARVGIIGAAALAVGVLAVGCSDETERPAPSPVTSHLKLRDEMRQLWMADVAWSRVQMMSATEGSPDRDFAAQRLRRNHTDIGNAIRPFLGDATADGLTTLMQENTALMMEIAAATSAGDSTRRQTAAADSLLNAEATARLLADANPSFAGEDLRALIRAQREGMLDGSTARLERDFPADIAAQDAAIVNALAMGDFMAQGIEDQFPEMVGPPLTSARDEELHLGMRAAWQGRVTWSRVFLLSEIGASQPASDFAFERLLETQADIGAAIQPFFGDASAQRLSGLLTQQTELTRPVFAATNAGDAHALAVAQNAWSMNGSEIARFFATENPRWRMENMEPMIQAHLNQMMDQANARMRSDWPSDGDAFDSSVGHTLSMSDALSAGVAEQFGLTPGVTGGSSSQNGPAADSIGTASAF